MFLLLVLASEFLSKMLFVETVVKQQILLVGMHLLDCAAVEEGLAYKLGWLSVHLFVLFGPLLLLPLELLLLVNRQTFLLSSPSFLGLLLLLKLPLPPL